MDCPFCYPEVEGSLTTVPPNHPEGYHVELTNDGTKKWFYCPTCEGLFCKDKMTNSWQLSAQTYTNFVSKGFLKDILQGG